MRFEYDRVAGRGTRTCTAGCAGPSGLADPSDVPALPALQPPNEVAVPHLPAAATRLGTGPVSGFWLTLGPPPGEVSDTTNSWLYVPLLHAAAADLAPAALQAWRTEPRASDWWERARQLLAASAPVTPQLLVAALARAAEAAPTHAHHMPDLVERMNNASLPTSACVHVGWAVRQLREPDGYLLTPVQEALLECFGGHQLASAVDRHSDRFRPVAAPPPAPPPAAGHAAVHPAPEEVRDDQPNPPEDDDVVLAAAAARVRDAAASRGPGRGRRGRGRGHRTTSNPPHPPHPAPAEPPPPTVSDPPPGRAPATTRRERAHALSEAGLRLGLASLDSVHLQSACRERTFTLQSSPARARGALRTAMRTGLRLVVHPTSPDDEVRGWKLFVLAPRMLLYRSPGEARVPPTELDRRVELFRAGRWNELLREASAAAAAPPSRQRGDPGTDEARAHRSRPRPSWRALRRSSRPHR